jgi:hypothetical protein
MATNRDLLKEAIADAKAVKEMAIANAKAALEEAFTPQLKSMLSAKLQEMEKEEIDETIYEEGKKETMDEELDLNELLNELNEEEEEESEEEGKPLDLEDMTDEDLKKLIGDVIADMVAAGELEAGEGEEEAEEIEDEEVEDEEINIDELLAEMEMEDKMLEMEDDKMNEVSAGLPVNDLYMVAGPLIALLAVALSIPKDTIKGMIKSKNPKTKEEFTKATQEVADELKKKVSTKEQVEETIQTLRNELNEVNLLNAKLLYSNKIFKAKNLTESQKVKVLSSLDKAANVKEAKLVYETLSEGLKEKRTPIKESLGMASKSMSAPTTKKPIVESDPMVTRFQKLAGII